MVSIFKKKYPGFEWNILYSVIIFILILAQIKNVAGPVIMPDEIGYWAAGAYLSGNDWSGIMYMSPYYGYGYGIFLGAVMRLFSNPVMMFKAAIVLNGVFMVVIYWITMAILTILKAEWEVRFRGLISCAVTLYAFNIYYSLNSEAEILQVMVYLFLCYLILQCGRIKKKFEIRMVFIPLPAVYMIACHQRNLGIAAALIFCVLLMLLSKKISIISFLSFVAVMGAGIIIFFKLKILVNENIFLVSNYTAEEAGKVSGALGIFTLKGIKSFVECVSGRIFYLGCVSFLLVYRGMAVIIRDIAVFLKKKRGIKKNGFLFFEIFTGMTLLAEIAIGALAFLGNEKRIDGFLYGRYNEHILIPVLLLGFISFHTLKDNTRVQITCSVLLLALGIYMHQIYSGYGTLETSTHSISAMIGMPVLRNADKSNLQTIFSSGVAQFSLLIAWILYLFLASVQKSKQIGGIILTAGCWIIFAINALHLYFYDFTDYNKELNLFAGQVLETIENDKQIYYLIDKEKEAANPTSSTWLMYRIQFYLPEIKIKAIDVNEIGEQDYVMVYKNSGENSLMSETGYMALVEGEKMILYYGGLK